MKDYISEISSPSISPDNLSGVEVQSYLRSLEGARQSFIGSVAQFPKNAVKAYLKELMDAKNVIIKRGFIGNEQPALEMVKAEVDGAELIYLCSILDNGLMQSLDKTISFMEHVLGDDEQREEHQPQKQKNLTTEKEVVEEKVDLEEKKEKQDKNDNIIGGLRKLSLYLAFSIGRTQNLSNSGVLKEAGIQYGGKGKWCFKKDKLDEYIKEHPVLFQPSKRKTSRKKTSRKG